VALAGFVSTSSGARVGAVADVPSQGFSAVLAAPAAGDLSYGVAEVRIVPNAGRGGATALGRRIFAQRVGGLAIVARSRERSRLGASSRVFVVVSRVAGADPSLREVAFFVVRRRIGRRQADSARGAIVVSIANARAALGSFWVRGIDRRGFAEIFQVRNMLSTAVGNWSRYLPR
jgi:hypothetical protein